MKRFVALLGLLLLMCPFVVVAAEEVAMTEPGVVSPEPPGGYAVGPRGEFQSSGDVFGSGTGYVHPYLSVGEVYTDNFYNTKDNKEEEWTTVVTPGIWGAFPALPRRPEQITTLNTAPGGMPLTRFRQNTGRRFQSYGAYSADFQHNKNFSDDEETTQRGEGMIDVNLRGGLGFNLAGIYSNTYDPFSTGANQSTQSDNYTSWTLDSLTTYDIGPKTDVRFDLGYYSLEYDKDRNHYRDRDDIKAGAALAYKISPKTRIFGQFEYIDINYDQSTQPDSEEYHYFAGMTWDLTGKSTGMVKAGYSDKKYKDDFDNNGEFVGELQLKYQFSPKTALNLTGTRQFNESDLVGTGDRITDFIGLTMTQQMTAKTSLKLNASYLNDDYQQKVTVGANTDYRNDDYYQLGIGAGWSAMTWLNLSVGYNYNDRNSNFDRYDYSSNSVYANATAAF
jgi:hypothetical protein